MTSVKRRRLKNKMRLEKNLKVATNVFFFDETSKKNFFLLLNYNQRINKIIVLKKNLIVDVLLFWNT